MTLPISNLANQNATLLVDNLRDNLLQGKSRTSFEQELTSLSSAPSALELSSPQSSSLADKIDAPVEKDELREAFQNFVGQTFFNQMLSSMRSTQREPAYFHGGQAEKIFQGQLDQILSDEMTKASASQIAEPMYDLFRLHRK